MDKRRVEKPNKIKLLTALLTAIVIFASSVLLTGCSFIESLMDGYADFTKSYLTMTVGDEYDLLNVIDSNTSRYSLSVSPSSVAKLSGTKLTALAVGNATVTAETTRYYSTMRVVVKDKEEDLFEVEAIGELIQQVGSVSDVVFTPTVAGSLASEDIVWYVNGKVADNSSLDGAFTYKPTSAGLFEIKAVCGNSSVKYDIRVYKPVSMFAAYTGEAVQSEPYSAVVFSATAGTDPANPDNYFEWFVDGDLAKDGSESRFSYMPTPGTHEVSLRVNGIACDISGKSSVTLVCKGSITPESPTLIYDNIYPHVYVGYEVAGKACVEITAPDGKAVEYKESDSAYASKFGEEGFDVGSIISLCASGYTRGAYKFRVKSLGDGGALTESDYSSSLIFTQLPGNASKYIKERYCDKDYYITSDVEYTNLLEYRVLSRTKTSGAKVAFDCYIDFDLPGSASDLWDDAFAIAATSGHYDGISVYMTGNVMHTEFKVSTVNAPTRQTYNSSNADKYSKQLHAIIPHINYDEDKYRPDDYEFYIDGLENKQTVSYTDELYFAAQNNCTPVAVSGSAADIVYKKAREIMRKIVTDDMTDVEKAHAIYDWIMWQVTYDSPATKIDDDGESYSAYYLEGVFGDGDTAIGGVKYQPYAVCDAMSKAYSLMCNMEGIPCVRVAGVAGEPDDTGGHAWNKVFVDGEWYIVDCTWGDAVGNINIGGHTSSYELAMHDNLFITDAMVASSHFEPKDTDETSIVYAPRTAKLPLDVYGNMTYNGVQIDCRIKAGDNVRSRLSDIATAFARAYKQRSAITVPGGPDGGVYSLTYEAIEVYFPYGNELSDSQTNMIVSNAIKTVHPFADVKVVTYSDVLIILMKTR